MKGLFVTRSRLPVVVAALLLSAVPALAQQKIAIANPIKILNELQETKDINNAMTAEQSQFQADANAKKAALEDLQKQRDMLKPDSPQWADKNKEMLQKKNEGDTWIQSTRYDMQHRFILQAKRMQDKITTAIAKVAKDKKIDLVLADQRPEVPDAQLDQMQPNQIMGILFGRNILFNSDSLDVTQDVIAELDKSYKAPAPAAK